MKTILFTAALALSGAAIAQTTPPSTDAAPARDSRGIPVASMPAQAPEGANRAVTVPPGSEVVVSPDQAQAFTPRQATEEFPPCTRERTDRCVQNYERPRR